MGNFEKHDRGDTLNPYEGERNLERDIRDGLYDHLLDANDGMELHKYRLYDSDAMEWYDDPEVKADLVRRKLESVPEPVTPKWRVYLSDGTTQIISAATRDHADASVCPFLSGGAVVTGVEQVEYDGTGWVRAKLEGK